MAENKKRFDQFDALRILAMFLIVNLHYIGHGGALEAGNVTACFLQGFSIIGVNLYIMLTGYFQSGKEFRIKKLFDLWTIVFFYSISFAFLFWCSGFPVSKAEIVSVLLPILTGQYWFITVYLALYMFSPYINRMLAQLNRREFTTLLILLLLLNSVFPTFLPKTMALNPVSGYGILWFLTMYCSGAYCRTYAVKFMTAQARRCVWGGGAAYVLSSLLITLICWSAQMLIERMNINSGLPEKLIAYNSPFVFVSTVCCFLCFGAMNIQSKAIRLIAPLTLGIYLIHDNIFVRKILYTKIFDTAHWYQSAWFLPVAMASTAAIFLLAAVVEYGRSTLFSKIFGLITTRRQNNTSSQSQ